MQEILFLVSSVILFLFLTYLILVNAMDIFERIDLRIKKLYQKKLFIITYMCMYEKLDFLFRN